MYGRGWFAFVTAIILADIVWDVIRHQYHGLLFAVPIYVFVVCVAIVVNRRRS